MIASSFSFLLTCYLHPRFRGLLCGCLERVRESKRERERERERERGLVARHEQHTVCENTCHTNHTVTCVQVALLFPSAGSRVLCSLFLPVSVRAVLVLVLTMTSDVLFSLAVERLPKQLASAMAQNGLLSPAILRYFPRKSAEELGLAPAQEVKMRKVLEGTTAIAAVGLGTIGMVGIVGPLWRQLAVLWSRRARRVQGQKQLSSSLRFRTLQWIAGLSSPMSLKFLHTSQLHATCTSTVRHFPDLTSLAPCHFAGNLIIIIPTFCNHPST